MPIQNTNSKILTTHVNVKNAKSKEKTYRQGRFEGDEVTL